MDNVKAQGDRYPDLKDRLSEFWMYSPCAEKRIPDDMREAVAWAWDEIVKARDQLTRRAVELEAWRNGRLIAKCGKNKDGFLLRVNHRSKLYSTITAVVDQLMAEREE